MSQRHLIPAAALSLAVALGACATDGAAPPADSGQALVDAPPSIAGRWESPCVAQGDDQSFSLLFDIGEDTWDLDYRTFGGNACEAPFLTVHIEGPYEITGRSSSVDDAYEARFGFTDKRVTPHMEAAVGFLASENGCGRDGFVEGDATSIFAEGCAGLGQYPEADCAADYDLVARDGDTLRFGDRPADNLMCRAELRPAALSQLAMQRL